MLRTSPTWLAIVGLGLLALESVLVAPSSAPITAEVIEAPHLGIQSMLTQILLAGALLIGLGAGLAIRSRIAYLVALLIGMVPLGVWMYLLFANDPIARQPLTMFVVTPPVLVVIGLVEAWPAFWESPKPRSALSRNRARANIPGCIGVTPAAGVNRFLDKKRPAWRSSMAGRWDTPRRGRG